MPNSDLDIERIAEVLGKHAVDYVLVGGLAVVLHGGETTTHDVDLAFDSSRANIERLADALEELGARPKRWRAERFRLQMSDLASQWLHLDSNAGDIDLSHKTPGVSYEELRSHMEQLSVGRASIFVASPRDLITLKTEAGRSRDLRHIEELKAIIELNNEPH